MKNKRECVCGGLPKKCQMCPQQWNPPETAPKDRMILLDVGIPWPVIGQWSDYENQWAWASVQANDDDIWFETDLEKVVKGWLPLPEVNI